MNMNNKLSKKMNINNKLSKKINKLKRKNTVNIRKRKIINLKGGSLLTRPGPKNSNSNITIDQFNKIIDEISTKIYFDTGYSNHTFINNNKITSIDVFMNKLLTYKNNKKYIGLYNSLYNFYNVLKEFQNFFSNNEDIIKTVKVESNFDIVSKHMNIINKNIEEIDNPKLQTLNTSHTPTEEPHNVVTKRVLPQKPKTKKAPESPEAPEAPEAPKAPKAPKEPAKLVKPHKHTLPTRPPSEKIIIGPKSVKLSNLTKSEAVIVKSVSAKDSQEKGIIDNLGLILPTFTAQHNSETDFEYNTTTLEPELIKKLKELKKKDKNPNSSNSGRELINISKTNYTPLYNVGASCYLNSVIQLLFAIPEFKDIIRHFKLDPRLENKEIIALKILVEYFEGGNKYVPGRILNIDDIREQLLTNTSTSRNENEVIAFQLKEKTIYNQLYLTPGRKYYQEDATELITMKLFPFIDKDVNNIFGYLYDEQITCPNGNKYIREKTNPPHFEKTLQIDIYDENDKNELIRILQILSKFKNSLEEKKIQISKEINKRLNQNLDVQNQLDESINIQALINNENVINNKNSLATNKNSLATNKNLLKNFLNNHKTLILQTYINKLYDEEQYTRENNFKSDTCITSDNPEGYALSHKITKFITTKYLIIYVKRFIYIDARITYKIKWKIDPNIIITMNGDKLYKLKSCIIHVGSSIASGHYIYLNFDQDGNPMHIIDDYRVYKYDGDRVSDHDYKRSGYVYLYELIEDI